jgi:hypothetical protein
MEEAEMATHNAAAPSPDTNRPDRRSPAAPASRQPGLQPPAGRLTERPAGAAPGVPLLVLSIVVLLAAVALLILARPAGGAAAVALIILGVLLLIGGGLALRGLFAVVPGEARVVQLFGRYAGTVREPGLRWVNPFTDRRRVSTRIRNHETALAKVNDADGNPIEIAAVVVWQVNDTALALYAVDDFVQFVATQTETAVRHIATSYPYDTADAGQLSLRGHADEVTERLSAEIAARVASAGVTIIESRLTGCLTRPRSPRPCCAARRRAPSSRRGRGSSRGPSAWSAWPCSSSKNRTSWNWTKSARPLWCPTCSWCCAASRPPSRWSTLVRCTSDGSLMTDWCRDW